MLSTLLAWLHAPVLAWSWMGLAVLICVALHGTVVPYGRHAREGWGLQVTATHGWLIMESVALLVFGALFWTGHARGVESWILFGIFMGHYSYRAGIYPRLMRAGGRPIPGSIVAMGMGFNLVNGALNGAALFHPVSPVEEGLGSPRFWLGLAMVLLGFFIHVRSDAILRKLRTDGGGEYGIPQGFLYRYLSCPNYLGEIVQWLGWAVLCWNLAGLSFAVWTIANLVPRAAAHHRWYRERFSGYPAERKALVPGLF